MSASFGCCAAMECALWLTRVQSSFVGRTPRTLAMMRSKRIPTAPARPAVAIVAGGDRDEFAADVCHPPTGSSPPWQVMLFHEPGPPAPLAFAFARISRSIFSAHSPARIASLSRSPCLTYAYCNSRYVHAIATGSSCLPPGTLSRCKSCTSLSAKLYCFSSSAATTTHTRCRPSLSTAMYDASSRTSQLVGRPPANTSEMTRPVVSSTPVSGLTSHRSAPCSPGSGRTAGSYAVSSTSDGSETGMDPCATDAPRMDGGNAKFDAFTAGALIDGGNKAKLDACTAGASAGGSALPLYM
mmetsp:Transcript_5701/g.15345  ORF Transcript_5701/g.15345 Transcript_5701/m.15345 type:complete len:298 (-) Transcript_5701:93-986(-)